MIASLHNLQEVAVILKELKELTSTSYDGKVQKLSTELIIEILENLKEPETNKQVA